MESKLGIPAADHHLADIHLGLSLQLPHITTPLHELLTITTTGFNQASISLQSRPAPLPFSLLLRRVSEAENQSSNRHLICSQAITVDTQFSSTMSHCKQTPPQTMASTTIPASNHHKLAVSRPQLTGAAFQPSSAVSFFKSSPCSPKASNSSTMTSSSITALPHSPLIWASNSTCNSRNHNNPIQFIITMASQID